MRRTAQILIIAAAGAAAPVAAQTVTYGMHDRGVVAPQLAFADADDGLNAYFYPDGYDPQYGSGGKLADVADFAADYGCRPIWDGRYGQYVEACNR